MSIAIAEPTCEDGFLNVLFTKVSGEERCEVRVSDASVKTDGLILIDKLTSTAAYCLNPGYYYISCRGPAVVNIQYLAGGPDNEYNKDFDLTASPYAGLITINYMEKEWTTVPESHLKPDFDKSKPLPGKPAYPKDTTY